MTTSSNLPLGFEVDNARIVTYLLNEQHPDGKGKAKFFLSWGFHPSRDAEFAGAILAHTKVANLTSVKHTQHGIRYIYEGSMDSPGGPTPRVRTVWQLDPGKADARLLTAHPF